MMIKDICIQSAPRSANTYLLYNLKDIDYRLEVRKTTKVHDFTFPNPDSVFVSILRNPYDAAISNATMSLNGTSETLTGGHFQSLIVNIIKEFDLFLDYLEKNINSIIPFTFEQIENNPEKVIDFILKETGYNEEYKFNNIVPEDKDITLIYENTVIQRKFLSTSKSIGLYDVLKNNTEVTNFDLINEKYQNTLAIVKKRQKQLNINF